MSLSVYTLLNEFSSLETPLPPQKGGLLSIPIRDFVSTADGGVRVPNAECTKTSLATCHRREDSPQSWFCGVLWVGLTEL